LGLLLKKSFINLDAILALVNGKLDELINLVEKKKERQIIKS